MCVGGDGSRSGIGIGLHASRQPELHGPNTCAMWWSMRLSVRSEASQCGWVLSPEDSDAEGTITMMPMMLCIMYGDAP